MEKSEGISGLIRNSRSGELQKSKSYKWFLLMNVMFGTFMAVLDATVVNTGLPKIMASLGISLDKAQWVITAYMLAMAVTLPTSGWMGDRFGYKRMYFIALFLFTAGSFLCSISPNEDMLIVSRVIQGFGAGFIQPLGLAIITREFPPEQRGIAIGFWSISAAASVSFGPLLGGYIVDHFNWQLIFGINVPVGALAMLFTLLIQAEYKNPVTKKFDLTGFITVTIFLPLTLYTLSEGSDITNSAGWHAPYILVCGAISLIMLTLFIINELTVEAPLIDLRLLANRNFGFSNFIMLFFSLGMFGSTFLLPVYLQNTMGYTAFQAGSVFLPVGIIQGIIAPLSGRIADRINPKLPVIFGALLMGISFWWNSKLSYLTELNYIMISLYIRGVGMGLMFTALAAISLLDVPRDKMAQASSLTNSIRQLGGSLGVAILATILTSRINFHTQEFGVGVNPSSEIYRHTSGNISFYEEHDAGESPSNATGMSRNLILTNLRTQAYIQGIDDDFFLASIVTLAGGLPIIFMRSKKSRFNQDPK